MSDGAFAELTNTIAVLPLVQKRELFYLLERDLYAEDLQAERDEAITRKLNEVYGAVADDGHAEVCDASLEVLRELTKNDSW